MVDVGVLFDWETKELKRDKTEYEVIHQSFNAYIELLTWLVLASQNKVYRFPSRTLASVSTQR